MERQVEKLEFKDNPNKEIKAAAYARVSSGKDAMLHSLASQVSYFKTMITKHPNWRFVEVYADEAMTGTKEDRDNFQRMIDDAKQGKIDLILVKSISRFARNTITLLTTIRELKDLSVDVYFEEENIHSISFGGELLMSILASYAQEESRSVSENMKWRIKRNFENGIGWGSKLYGYKVEKNETFTIIESEAEVIRLIYKYYLSDYGIQKITNTLNKQGYKTRNGNNWCKSSVRIILTNIYYTGDKILQKTYRDNHINKKTKINHGEKAQYYVQDSHEGIISKEDFGKVQEMMRSKVKRKYDTTSTYPFSGKLICSICGSRFKRKVRPNGDVIWRCRTFDEKGKEYCESKQIPEYAIEETVKRALAIDKYDTDIFLSKVKNITVCPENTLIINLNDGRQITEEWVYKSRSESWTPEMKEKARLQTIENNKTKKRGENGRWLKQ